jgi:hypothetical protein
MLEGNIRTQRYPLLVLNGVALDIAAQLFFPARDNVTH